MKELIESLEKATKDMNWHAALFIALAIPDICGKFEFPKKNVGERYKTWFDIYLKEFYEKEVGAKREKVIFLNAADCYSLRCALLHEGSDDITNQRSRDILNRFVFSTTQSHLLKVNNGAQTTLILNVGEFCKEVYSAALIWSRNTDTKFSILSIHTSKSISL
jgi:hypothetical protein